MTKIDSLVNSLFDEFFGMQERQKSFSKLILQFQQCQFQSQNIIILTIR